MPRVVTDGITIDGGSRDTPGADVYKRQEEKERDLALFMDMVLMGRCKEVWVFGTIITSGMTAEIAKAKQKHMTIRYFTEDCKEITEE